MSDTKSISKYLLPMYVLNWVFAVCVIECPLGKPRPVISFVYATVCLTIYCSLCYAIYPHITESVAIPSIDVSMKLLFYSHILITFSTISLGWYHSEGLRNCVIRTVTADNLMEHIGIPKMYMQMFKAQIAKLILGLIVAVFLLTVNSLYTYIFDKPLDVMIMSGIVMSYPIFLMNVAETTFTCIVSSTCYRFIQLNNLLSSLSPNDNSNLSKLSLKSIDQRNMLNSNYITGVKKNHIVIIKIARQIHLQLVKICQEVDNVYALQILLSIAVAFSVITGNMYVMFVVLVDLDLPRYTTYNVIIGCLIWVAYYGLKIFCSAWVCSYCVEQSVRTGTIINKFYDDVEIDEETRTEIRNFNVQLIQRPLKFAAFGFINIDFTLIQGISASITTYLMILIQLRHPPNHHPHIFNKNST